MKIGLVSLRWEGHHTSYTKLTAEGLIKQGHTVTVFIPANHKYQKEFYSLEGCNIEKVAEAIPSGSSEISKFIRSNLRQRKQFNHIFNKSNSLDIIHILTLDLLQVPLWLASLNKEIHCPMIATIHRKDPFRTFPTQKTMSLNTVENVIRVLPRKMIDFSLMALCQQKKMNMLLTHSTSVREQLISSINCISEESVNMIPVPTPPISNNMSKTEAKQAIDAPIDKKLLLFFGEMRREKGPDILLRALENINEELVVIFAGKSGYISEKDIDEAKLSSNVKVMHRLEYIPEEDIDLYFIAADCLVLPYRRTEGISATLRRGCMANAHIIGPYPSDIGSVIKRHNLGQTFKTGSVASLVKTIQEFLDSDEYYPKEDVILFSNNQNYINVAEKLLYIYESVIDK